MDNKFTTQDIYDIYQSYPVTVKNDIYRTQQSGISFAYIKGDELVTYCNIIAFSRDCATTQVEPNKMMEILPKDSLLKRIIDWLKVKLG